MSDSQRTEELILQVLGSEGNPLDASSLIKAVQRINAQVDEWEIKKAVWRLTADEKAQFTSDFQVQLTSSSDVAMVN